MIDNQEMPIGFTMELAEHSEALVRFSQMSEQDQKSVVNGARTVKSRQEMRDYVENIFRP